MKHALNIPGISLFALLAVSALQAQQPADSDADEAQTGQPDQSREVEISEDNYRRFMELKDQRVERPAFPTPQYTAPSGLEKMAQLPESSQKHLRNELREIILESGPWSEAERGKPYRFTPTKEAQGNQELLKKEAEAWAELVGEYHDREAASLAAGSAQKQGSQALNQDEAAATGNPSESSGAPGSMQASASSQQGANSEQSSGEGEGQGADGGGSGSPGDNDAGKQGAQGQQAASEQDSQRPRPQWSESSTAADSPPQTPSTAGVEQSAKDFLSQAGYRPTAEPGESPGTSTTPADPENANVQWAENPVPEKRMPDERTPAQSPPPRNPSSPAAPDQPENEGQQRPPGVLSISELREARGIQSTNEESVEAAFDALGITEEVPGSPEPDPDEPKDDNDRDD